MDLTGKGTSVLDLPELYVVFICDFDPLGAGLRRYTVEKGCKEGDLQVDDGVHEVYLCCSSGDGERRMGFIEGQEQGLELRDRQNEALAKALAAAGRADEFIRTATDPGFRSSLLAEFGIEGGTVH